MYCSLYDDLFSVFVFVEALFFSELVRVAALIVGPWVGGFSYSAFGRLSICSSVWSTLSVDRIVNFDPPAQQGLRVFVLEEFVFLFLVGVFSIGLFFHLFFALDLLGLEFLFGFPWSI